MGIGTGAAVGVADQLIQNRDERAKRNAAAAGETLSMWKEVGTYYNYGLPVAVVLASAMGWLPGIWQERLAVAAGAVAGRKATFTLTKAQQSLPWRPMQPAARSVGAPPARRTLDQEFAGTGIV
jgi:hypothetical protein